VLLSEVAILAVKKNTILVPDHSLVPKHEIMTKKEALEVLEKFHCTPTELPLIFANDPAIISLGVKPGDMIKITRKSATAGESLYYRYVVEV
jgi:DNA-directed RNA polymerase subunit H